MGWFQSGYYGCDSGYVLQTCPWLLIVLPGQMYMNSNNAET